ncbi:zinc-binding dehydrogenase [Candidatus Bathyarchaeota archaeon]|nr:zinc-binding dehydrogenase [Candidatus Bathyarchaeota archaeon]
MNQVKAALLYEKDDMRIVDLPMPTVGPNDILLHVKAAKICPTDLRKYRLGSRDVRIHDLPTNLCHEFTGEIVDLGENVKEYMKGMRIVGLGHAGNAEYVLLNTSPSSSFTPASCLELAPNVSYEEGTFVVPLSENIHGIVNQADLRFGQTIVIVGTGQMGLQQVNIAHWCGANVIATDIDEGRLEIAKELGADAVINPAKENVVEAVKKLNHGQLADCSVATLGISPVIQQAIDVTRNCARVVVFGGTPAGITMQFNPNDVHYSEKMLIGVEGTGVPPNIHPEMRSYALKHIASGKINVKKLITRVMPMTDIVKAYKMIERKEALSIVLNP